MILRGIVILVGAALVAGAVANAEPGLSLSRGLTDFGSHVTKVSDVSDTHQQYLDRMRADMKQWQARMQQWNADVKARGAEMSAAASHDLNQAWVTLQVDWKRLQIAGDDAWAKTRVSFDHASQKMKASWQSINPSS